jgi:hypothetical protein
LRVAERISLTEEQKLQLGVYARGRKVERRLAERASIILLAAENADNLEIAAKLGVSRQTVALANSLSQIWHRWNRAGCSSPGPFAKAELRRDRP